MLGGPRREPLFFGLLCKVSKENAAVFPDLHRHMTSESLPPTNGNLCLQINNGIEGLNYEFPLSWNMNAQVLRNLYVTF